MQSIAINSFEEWRQAARRLAAGDVPPESIQFEDGDQTALFPMPAPPSPNESLRVPPAFLELAAEVGLHRSPSRWPLLYRTLYRLTHGERHLLEITVDPDIRELHLMQKAVARDVHKMHAFVRFRKVPGVEPEQFIAWYRPDHLIVERVGPWFAQRFGSMNWAIITPDRSAYWDTRELRYGPGVPRSEAPQDDELEDLWRAYYSSVFNPARLKVKAMKTEMPVRHWSTLPETQLIPGLIAQAQNLEPTTPPSGAQFLPADRSLPALKQAIPACQGCDLYRHATQAVFGEGPPTAPVMFVGEQPGDMEDLQGRPFVGPAGQLWNRALKEAGLPRDKTYVTNSVKHFKFEERGKRRIHKKPGGTEIAACRPWLEAEIEAVQPQLIVALGATAALALAGRDMSITRERGKIFPLPNNRRLFVTIHPSFLLRIQDAAEYEAQYRLFVEDLRAIAEHVT